MITKQALTTKTAQVLADSEAIKSLLEDEVAVIPEVYSWLGRLKLLHGVPFNYLVPDERMLPPESIRFFYLDMNWVDALIDGAYSIGRNLTQDRSTYQSERNTDKVTLDMAHVKLNEHAKALRAKLMGKDASISTSLETVTGFLLRSRAVSEHPGIGVYAYASPQDTPESNQADESKVKAMPILRLERLGHNSDVLLCLLEGDAYRIDIHEAPENLHYGIDSYTMTNGQITKAVKGVRKYTKDGNNQITIQAEVPVDISDCFREERTLNVSRLAQKIGAATGKSDFDSAQLGFEMTEGVGLVRFVKH